jgi:flagellar biosynthesis protein FliP
MSTRSSTRTRPKLTGAATLGAVLLISLLTGFPAAAQIGLPAFTMAPQTDGAETYTLSIQFLALMTALTLLPAVVLMMTSFTRIIIVLAILRQALGTMNTPSNQVLLGLSLFLTLFIMTPVIERINNDAVQPYLEETILAEEALERAKAPLRRFMLAHIRETDLLLFANLSGLKALESRETVPFSLLLPAFVTSELKTAFQIGFLIFIPFLIIDLVVASVLMGMGMVMLSPMVISFPFKIMLFVLVDGWALVMGTLAGSFIVT